MTHTGHGNDMSIWDSITCQRGHSTHCTQRVTVNLAHPHGYHDYPQLPTRLARSFEMDIYPPSIYPVDGGPYCVDADTEALTRDGWKRWSELTPGVDVLYGYDTETGLGRWAELLALNVLPDEERSMLVMSGRHHSSVTTAEHRWWVERRRQAKRYEANQLVSITEAVPRAMYATSAQLTARDRVPCAAPSGDLPSEPKYSDALVELVAWFWTEGHAERSGAISISQSHHVNARNVARIRAALTVLYGSPIKVHPRYRNKVPEPAWSERTTSTTMTRFRLNRSGAAPLLDAAPDKATTPAFVASLTRSQLQLFVDVALLGDGTGKRRIAQRERSRLEPMQMAWTLLGERTVLRYKPSEDMWWLTINARQSVQIAGLTREWEQRSGIVWCPTTATETWLARRDGHTFFTGNCPAHDAVSETIVSHRIWEPRETILTLTVCESAEPGQIMVDVGAQIGWFSLLAASCGVEAIALDADTENLRLLEQSVMANDWAASVSMLPVRIGTLTELPMLQRPIRLAKIDIEGAENDAVRVFWPSIEAGLVDHLLIEISPCFADYYPDLVQDLVDVGYRAYLLPPKAQPPVTLYDPENDLKPWRLDTQPALREIVASWHQENVWFQREGASW